MNPSDQAVSRLGMAVQGLSSDSQFSRCSSMSIERGYAVYGDGQIAYENRCIRVISDMREGHLDVS